MATENKNPSLYDKNDVPDGANFKIGLVVSEWNGDITENLYKGAWDALVDCGVKQENIFRFNVPGSFELPFGCKKMMATTPVNAVVAIGSVIRGETSHFDYVCGATAQGIMELNIRTDVPVIFCVLTDDTLQQSRDRSGGKHGNKGIEAAIAAIKMCSLGKQL